MHRDRGRLEILAARAAQGSSAAAARFREELETYLARMVRRALRGGTGSAALDGWILAEVEQAAADRGGPGGDPERLLAPVVRRLCQSVLARLRQRPAAAPPATGSTVRGA
jgi:hypothetical protein